MIPVEQKALPLMYQERYDTRYLHLSRKTVNDYESLILRKSLRQMLASDWRMRKIAMTFKTN